MLVRARARRTLAATLGRGRIYRAIRRAIRLSLARPDFRIVELAIRGRDLELIIEARDRIALARGMQGFQVSAARALNRAAARRGNVFVDRYRATQLDRPTVVRGVLDFVAGAVAARPCRPTTRLLARARPRGADP